jgi:hypothetical protein
MNQFKKDDVVYFQDRYGYQCHELVGTVKGFTMRNGIMNVVIDSNGNIYAKLPEEIDKILDRVD